MRTSLKRKLFTGTVYDKGRNTPLTEFDSAVTESPENCTASHQIEIVLSLRSFVHGKIS